MRHTREASLRAFGRDVLAIDLFLFSSYRVRALRRPLSPRSAAGQPHMDPDDRRATRHRARPGHLWDRPGARREQPAGRTLPGVPLAGAQRRVPGGTDTVFQIELKLAGL